LRRRGRGALAAILLAAALLAVGCRRRPVPTFSSDIAALVHTKCAGCHRPGEAGPFPLISYEDVGPRARQIARVTASRFMPPWKPVPGHADYLNDRSLSAAEIDTLARWAAAGAPVGDAARVPPPPRWPEGWQLGEPDLVARLPEPYTLPGDGRDVYRNFVLPAPSANARWVAAWEFRPGSRAVHHAILNIDRAGWARARDAAEPGPGYGGMSAGRVSSPDGFYLVWTPGKSPTPPSPGTAWRLDEHTDLVLQVHFQPTGKPETVTPTIGLRFTDQPPTVPRASLKIGDPPIDISPGERSYRITDRFTFPADVLILGLFPHAHYLATRMRCWLTLPDGSRRWLLFIDDWDFLWQEEYLFRAPVAAPRGATVDMEFFYDNSMDNPRNPSSPPRRVRSGEQSTDEMGNITLQLAARDARDLDVLREAKYRRALGGGDPAVAEYNLGNALLRQNRLDDAIAHYRLALASDARLAPAHLNLGNALAAGGRAAEAAASFERGLALDPSSLMVHTSLGRVYEMLGRRADAVAQYRRALQIDARYAPAAQALAALENSK
jgi:hypothetical protein